MAMNNTLYIPETIVVGFQKRTDTFTGKLAYVIYKDHTGKLRKEASWQSWRDKNIQTLEIPNTPNNGFTFNKGVQRHGYWGSGRSVVRVWDPRDFEFEISVSNLIGILMHADVSKRDITEPCVYAWSGTELILLPTNSQEYQESVKHTAKQSVKFSTKDLKVGYTYGIKSDSTTRVVYLGHFDRYAYEGIVDEKDTRGHYRQNKKYYGDHGWKHVKKSKQHVFIDEQHHIVHARSPNAFISGPLTDEVHPQFAKLMDIYYSDSHAHETQPVIDMTLGKTNQRFGNWNNRAVFWYKVNDTEYVQMQIQGTWNHYQKGNKFVFNSVAPIRFARFDKETTTLHLSSQSTYYNNYTQYNPTSLTDAHPVVKELKTNIYNIITKLNDEGNCKRLNDAMDEIKQQYEIGDLRFVLANGKIDRTKDLNY